MGYEIYQKHGESWVKVSDPQSLINDTLSSASTTWSSNALKSRFEALSGGAKVEIVATRPETGTLNTIYYVGSASPYQIWLYANNTSSVATWFDMGTTSIDLTNYYTKTEAEDTFLKLTGGTLTGEIMDSLGSKYLPIKKKVFEGRTDANGFISASDLGVNQIPIGFSMDGTCQDDPILYLFISSASGTYHRLKCMSWSGTGLNNRYIKGVIYYIDVTGV